MHRAPYHEVQRAAVPEPGDDEGGEEVENGPSHAAAAAAQWEIDIAHDEVAERHVPPLPEILHAYGRIGHVEVLRKREAQDERGRGHQVDEAAEVAVKLDGIGVYGGEERQSRIALRAREDIVRVVLEAVGANHDLEYGEDNKHRSPVLIADFPFPIELPEKAVRGDDRAHDDGREK